MTYIRRWFSPDQKIKQALIDLPIQFHHDKFLLENMRIVPTKKIQNGRNKFVGDPRQTAKH
jgi:hypothetical protein